MHQQSTTMDQNVTMDHQNSVYKQELKRTLKLSDLLIYGLLFLVPIAPMGVFGFVYQSSHGMIASVYLVGLIAMLFTALSYVKFSKRYPFAGSAYSYVQRAINPHVGFIAGWLLLIDYILVPCLCYYFATVWIASLIPGIPFQAWFIIFVAFNTFINIMGIDWTAKLNWVFLIIECLLLALVLILGIAFIAKGGGAGHFSLTPFYQPGFFNMGFIATAASIAVLSFLGFDGISTLSEEAHNPQKNIPRATFLVLVLAGVIFIVQCYIGALCVPDLSSVSANTAFSAVTDAIGGHWLTVLFTFTMIIAAGLANSCVAQSAISRILFCMSRDKLMPAAFSKVHKKYQTPYIAILFVSAISIIIGCLIKLDLLVTLVNFGALTTFMILNFSVFWLFFIKEKNRNVSGFFNYIILPFIGIGVIAFVWSGLATPTKIMGVCWLAAGIIYGAIKSKGYKEVPDAFRNMNV